MSSTCSYASILESLSASYKVDSGRKSKSARNASESFRDNTSLDFIQSSPVASRRVDIVQHREEDDQIDDATELNSNLTLTMEPKQTQNQFQNYGETSFPPVPPSAMAPIMQRAPSQLAQHTSSYSAPSATLHSATATLSSGAGSLSQTARPTPTGSLSTGQNGAFVIGLDEAMHTFRRMVLEAYSHGVGESVEHEIALLTKDNTILSDKLAHMEQELLHLQHEHKVLKAQEVHKSECCERMAEFIGHLKQEKRDALMLHRLLLRWKRNARLEASHNHVVNTMDDIRKSRIVRDAIMHWRLICYKKRYMRVFEDAHDAVAKVREERELYFKEERERYKREIELLQTERNEYLIKEKGLKDQMKQAFLRGINALTDEATTALDHDGALRSMLQGLSGNIDAMGAGNGANDTKKVGILSEKIAVAETDCDYQEYLNNTEQDSSSMEKASINHEAFLYSKGGHVTSDHSHAANTTETFSGFMDDDPAQQGIPCNYYVDDSPMNINVVQHGVHPGQHRAQPIHRQEATGVIDPSTVRPPYMKHVKSSRGPAPMTIGYASELTRGGVDHNADSVGKFQMGDCLSKRLRSIHSMSERRDNISTAMYHENLTAVKNRVSVSRN